MALVVTGAQALIKISGNVVLFAGGVQVEHENRLEEIAQIDDLEVVEYAENGHRCSITINSFKLAPDAALSGQPISNTATDFNMDYHSGSDTLTGKNFKSVKNTELKQILLQPEMIIEVVTSVPVRDSKGNIIDYQEASIYTANGAKFEGGSGSLSARGIWEGSWRFKARRGTGI